MHQDQIFGPAPVAVTVIFQFRGAWQIQLQEIDVYNTALSVVPAGQSPCLGSLRISAVTSTYWLDSEIKNGIQVLGYSDSHALRDLAKVTQQSVFQV
jgi:hypothetical protein